MYWSAASLDIALSDNMISGDAYGTENGSDIDFAINAGFGYQAPSGLGFEFRFKKGIADVMDSDYYESGDGFFFGDYNTNILFQLGLTYTFKTKK
ncbi:hypothetical protein [Flavobacterium sp. 3HN19-14]|uniref:hypothetical protein n=1 Tax=Flavobacterium sp. 3HN19-14 TaxID=3448133 RepID=UPI003EE33528